MILSTGEVDMPNLVSSLNWTPIVEWCVVKCGSKNGYPKDMCLEKIGLCAQNSMAFLGSTINIIGGIYMTT
jgi:hypothetical protein